jgi:hypothetical protein
MYTKPVHQHKVGTEAEFLDEIRTKVLRVFHVAIHRHLYSFAFEISISSNSRNLLRFLQFTEFSYRAVTVKETRGKPDRKPYPLFYGLKNPYSNLKSENSQDYPQKPQQNCAVHS